MVSLGSSCASVSLFASLVCMVSLNHQVAGVSLLGVVSLDLHNSTLVCMVSLDSQVAGVSLLGLFSLDLHIILGHWQALWWVGVSLVFLISFLVSLNSPGVVVSLQVDSLGSVACMKGF